MLSCQAVPRSGLCLQPTRQVSRGISLQAELEYTNPSHAATAICSIVSRCGHPTTPHALRGVTDRPQRRTWRGRNQSTRKQCLCAVIGTRSSPNVHLGSPAPEAAETGVDAEMALERTLDAIEQLRTKVLQSFTQAPSERAIIPFLYVLYPLLRDGR